MNEPRADSSDVGASAVALLADAVARSVRPEAAAWLREALASLGTGFEKGPFLAAYAGAGRRLRGSSLELSSTEAEALGAQGLQAPMLWSTARAARTALLCSAVARARAGEREALVEEIFRTGDNEERQALLGALMVLAEPERYVATAVDACRTNVRTVFEAIACENAYPATFFPEAHFNQMVLKAIFLEIPVQRISGLAGRVNAELVRMASDYGSERRAAGRSVPEDIAVLASMQEG